MNKQAKLYVLDPEGILYTQFSKMDIKKLNITFARKLDTLLEKANMSHADSLLVDSENTEQWENGKSLSDQLPNGMKVFATSVGGGEVTMVGNPIDISLLYKKIDEENSFVGQFLDSEPDRVKRKQSIDSVLNIKDKDRYKNMDNIIATINKQEIDEVIMKEWNDPHKDLELELDDIGILEVADEASDLNLEDGNRSIELNEFELLDSDDFELPFELEIEGEDVESELDKTEPSSPEVEVEVFDLKPEVEVLDFEPENEILDLEPEVEILDLEPEIEVPSTKLESEETSNLEPESDEDERPYNHLYDMHYDEFEDWEEEEEIEREPVKTVIPYKTYRKKNLQLKVGEEMLVQEGVDGWVKNGEYVEPVDELIEVGPDVIKEVPYAVEHREVSYIVSGLHEVISPGEVGLEADGVLIKDPVDRIILVGTGVVESEPANKSDESEEQSKPKRRRRRRRRRRSKETIGENTGERTEESTSKEIEEGAKTESVKETVKDKPTTPRVDKLLDSLDFFEIDLDDNSNEKSQDIQPVEEAPIEQVDTQPPTTQDDSLSFLESLLGESETSYPVEEEVDEENETTSIDDLLSRLQGGG